MAVSVADDTDISGLVQELAEVRETEESRDQFYPRPFIFGEVLYDHFLAQNESKLGGAPFNVAWNLCGLGLNPIFVSKIGKDSDGSKILKEAKSWNMDCSNIQIDKSGHPTGNVKITLDSVTNDASYDIVKDVAYDFIDVNEITLPRDLIRMSKIASRTQDTNSKVKVFLYHGTLALRNKASKDALYAFINDLETNYSDGIEVLRFVDVNLRAPFWSVDETIEILSETNVKYVKLNEEELPLLYKTTYKDAKDMIAVINDSINFTAKYGLKALVVTLGSNGSLIINKTNPKKPEILTIKVSKVAHAQTFEQFYAKRDLLLSKNKNNSNEVSENNLSALDTPAVPTLTKQTSLDTFTPHIKIADTVGAGDSYASVIIAGLVSNWSMLLTMNRADNLACKVVTVTGALLKQKKEYFEIVSNKARSVLANATITKIYNNDNNSINKAEDIPESPSSEEAEAAASAETTESKQGSKQSSNTHSTRSVVVSKTRGVTVEGTVSVGIEKVQKLQNGMVASERERVRDELWYKLGMSRNTRYGSGSIPVTVVSGNNSGNNGSQMSEKMNETETVLGITPNLSDFSDLNKKMIDKIHEINRNELESVLLNDCELIAVTCGAASQDEQKIKIIKIIANYCVLNLKIKPIIYKLSYLPVYCNKTNEINSKNTEYLKQWWLETFNNSSDSDATIVSGALFTPSNVNTAAMEFEQFMREKLNANNSNNISIDKNNNNGTLKPTIYVSKANFRIRNEASSKYVSFFQEFSEMENNQTISKIERNRKPFLDFVNETKQNASNNGTGAVESKEYKFKARKLELYDNLLKEAKDRFENNKNKYDPQAVIFDLSKNNGGGSDLFQRLYLESILDDLNDSVNVANNSNDANNNNDNNRNNNKYIKGFKVDIIGIEE